jgi:hypothetical protein
LIAGPDEADFQASRGEERRKGRGAPRIHGEVRNLRRDSVEGRAQPLHHREERQIGIARRQWLAEGDNLVDSFCAGHDANERRRTIQDDAPRQLTQERRITGELDYVA